jgi:hopene-associated glycosyltransferase HpnB
MTLLIALSSTIWLTIWLLPWRPWSVKEQLEHASSEQDSDLSDITVLIPARNEATCIPETLASLEKQGKDLAVVVVDDQSSDGTAELAQKSFAGNLRIVRGKELPDRWVGKLWALQQGLDLVTTPLILLLDADIELAPGTIDALKNKLTSDKLALVSLMADLRKQTSWEIVLCPAFIFFFKLLYPFGLGNDPRTRLGVAAGGCILIRADMLQTIGGFAAFKDNIIDDCELAKRVKKAGGCTWIGLTHSVKSQRGYPTLASFWHMVTRTAFTQLHYSIVWLLVTTFLMLLLFWFPVLGLASHSILANCIAGLGLLLMWGTYLPTVRFYRQSPVLVMTLPLVATLYLLMTWSSAIRYWRGQRSSWKGRSYQRRNAGDNPSVKNRN